MSESMKMLKVFVTEAMAPAYRLLAEQEGWEIEVVGSKYIPPGQVLIADTAEPMRLLDLPITWR